MSLVIAGHIVAFDRSDPDAHFQGRVYIDDSGAIVCVTQGEGFAMVWREGEERTRFEIKSGSIYSPGDLMYHGHFNTGHGTLRHFAMRGRSPKFSQDRFRTKLHEMIPFDEEPADVHPMFLEELKRKGVKSKISVVEE